MFLVLPSGIVTGKEQRERERERQRETENSHIEKAEQ
jgi:hypothetical protein